MKRILQKLTTFVLALLLAAALPFEAGALLLARENAEPLNPPEQSFEAEAPANNPAEMPAKEQTELSSNSPSETSVESTVTKASFLLDLFHAYESVKQIDKNAAALNNELFYAAAEAWKTVYLDPDYHLYLYGTDDPSELPVSGKHAFVVLGYELENGEMQQELKGRCEAAATAAKAFPDSLLVCSGGATGPNNPDKHTEAGLMKDYLVSLGIAPERILTDERAMTTAENAINTFAMLQEREVETITLVTSSYHMRWAQALYRTLAAKYKQKEGYYPQMTANFCLNIEPSVPLYRHDAMIAMIQLAEILELSTQERALLPGLKDIARMADEPEKTNVPALKSIQDRGVLRVGSTGDYKPLAYLDPDTKDYWGFDVELAYDLAAWLGVSVEFVPTTWPTLMEDTLAGKFDLALCGITITEARKEQALMSIGYLGNGKTILCRAEDAAKYTSLEAVNRPEVRVMENPGGLNEKFARENLPDAQLIIHEINQEIPGLIAAGEADVMITEILEAGYYVGQDDRLAAPLLSDPFTHGELGFLLPKGSDDLLIYVNAFIAGERVNGRLARLAEEYIYGPAPSEETELPDAA